MRATTPNAHFWVDYRGSWVKLTLKPEQQLAVGYSEPDEEGYSFQRSVYTHEGHRVVEAWSNGGRDCDGTITHSGVCWCSLDELQAHEFPRDPQDHHEGKPIMLPKWEKMANDRIYDEYAQAAGY